MATGYQQLTVDDRNLIQRGLNTGMSCRQIAQRLGRCPSTVTREITRNQTTATYDAVSADRDAHRRRRRGRRKLVAGSPLLPVVITDLKAGWSPEQIAGRLKHRHPDEPQRLVSHETIYRYIYAQPRGELRKTLIAALRQAHKTRLPRTRGQDELCSNLVYQPGLMELGRRRTVADNVVVKAQSSNEEVRHARRYVQTDHPRK